eukprot:scaffold207479_cov45-Prasinocladus_malaysianus.AAC.1
MCMVSAQQHLPPISSVLNIYVRPGAAERTAAAGGGMLEGIAGLTSASRLESLKAEGAWAVAAAKTAEADEASRLVREQEKAYDAAKSSGWG